MGPRLGSPLPCAPHASRKVNGRRTKQGWFKLLGCWLGLDSRAPLEGGGFSGPLLSVDSRKPRDDGTGSSCCTPRFRSPLGAMVVNRGVEGRGARGSLSPAPDVSGPYVAPSARPGPARRASRLEGRNGDREASSRGPRSKFRASGANDPSGVPFPFLRPNMEVSPRHRLRSCKRTVARTETLLAPSPLEWTVVNVRPPFVGGLVRVLFPPRSKPNRQTRAHRTRCRHAPVPLTADADFEMALRRSPRPEARGCAGRSRRRRRHHRRCPGRG